MTVPNKRNKLQIYTDTKVKRKSAMKLKVDHFKQPAEFFGKTFLTLESRNENLKEFLGMRQQAGHPLYHLEDCSTLVPSQIILKCVLDPMTSKFDNEPVSPAMYDFIVFDGGYLIHTVTRKATKGKPSANVKKCFFFLEQHMN